MKLIILDRDGVINQESREYIKSPAEWIPIAGSIQAIARLTKAGYTIAVVTNQSGVGRGYLDLEALNAIHAKMLSTVREHGGDIYKIYYCPHHPDDDCACRKPKPGMFAQLAQDLNCDLASIGAIFVGDSLRDVELGINTGCKFYLTTGPGSDGNQTLIQLTREQKQKITIAIDLHDVTNRLLNA